MDFRSKVIMNNYDHAYSMKTVKLKNINIHVSKQCDPYQLCGSIQPSG